MIAHVRGNVLHLSKNTAIIDTGALGYEVFITKECLASLQKEQVASLWTVHHITENDTRLYGFKTLEEKEMFLILTAISGIGPKMGLTILSALSKQEIITAIQQSDVTAFSSISGVGAKTASRILVELRTRFDSEPFVLDPGTSSDTEDVIAALKTFGYSTKEVTSILKDIEPSLSTEEKITTALQKLGSSG